MADHAEHVKTCPLTPATSTVGTKPLSAVSPLADYRERNPIGWERAVNAAMSAGDRAVVLFDDSTYNELMTREEVAARITGGELAEGATEHPVHQAMRTRKPGQANFLIVHHDGSFDHARAAIMPH
jgi:hypothetical protein